MRRAFAAAVSLVVAMVVMLSTMLGMASQPAPVLAASVECGPVGDPAPYSGELPDSPTAVNPDPLTPQLQGLYQQGAAASPEVPWPVLAAIGWVESGHGSDMGPSSAGAVGWMQFLPSTWDDADPNLPGQTYGQNGNPNLPEDAIPAAGRYLVAFGADGTPEGLERALYAYNHDGAYVDKVIAVARVYAGGATVTAPAADAAPLSADCDPVPFAAMSLPVTPGGCTHPLPGARLTSPWGPRWGRLHDGLDLSTVGGSGPGGTVVAAAAGVVVSATVEGGYGNIVRLQVAPDTVTFYAHLYAMAPLSPGQPVTAGAPLGVEGTTGASRGTHLHFGLSVDGRPSDPRPWLAACGVDVGPDQ